MANRQKILLIDDNSDIREMVSSLLVHLCGAEVVEAENGLEGLSKYDESFDLVITDCDMPVMNGLRFTEEMRSMKKEVPIVMFSASDEAKETFLQKLNGEAFFEKTESRELAHYTKKVLENGKTEKEKQSE